MNRFLEHAIDIASKSKCRYKHGCVIVANGVVIATATNKKIRDVTPSTWRASYVHAEEAAVAAARHRARGATAYIARVNRVGEPVLSKPCKRCERRLARIGISRVVWT